MTHALRRLRSLRSAASFASPSPPPEPALEIDTKLAVLGRRFPSRRGKRVNTVTNNGKIIPRGITMTAFDEEGRPPPPELDREVDLLCCAVEDKPTAPYYIFEKLHLKPNVAACSIEFFSLTPKIKHLVYSFCFLEEERKITLSPRFATKAVFDDEYFASPWQVLEPVWGGLSASQEIRKELLTYFWTEHHFHVSINPFNGPKLSPLSQVWLPPYLGIIQHLTIEVDLTRFGGSALKYAPSIGYNSNKLEKLLVNLMNGLQDRPNNVPIAELIILSRRYLGNRPVDGTFITKEEVPWYPPELVLFRQSIRGLRGMLQRCRVAGFSREYTKVLLNSVFSDDDRRSEFVEPRETAWPFPPLYEPPIRAPTTLNEYSIVAFSEYGDKVGSTARRLTYSTDEYQNCQSTPRTASIVPSLDTSFAITRSEWELTLHHSASLSEMFRREMNGSQESLSSNYTTSYQAHPQEGQGPLSQQDEIQHTSISYAQDYQSLLSLAPYSPSTTPNSARDVSLTPQPSICLTEELSRAEDFSPKIVSSPVTVICIPSNELSAIAQSPRNSEVKLCPIAVDSLTAQRRGIPSSMSSMNAMNEQDPAFIRTMEALHNRQDNPHGFNSEKTHVVLPTTHGLAQGSERCFSSMSSSSAIGTKKKHKSFLKRLRGRISS